MNATKARKLAVEAIERLSAGDHEPVADATVAGLDPDGRYWVADNGESIEGLTKAQAIEIIVENLTT